MKTYFNTKTNYNLCLMLIVLNVIFYFILRILSQNATYFLCLNPVMVLSYHAFWQFVTYMFVHENMIHLLFNMLALFFFGIGVERYWGSKEFLIFYIVCGLFSGLISFLIYILCGMWNVFLMGASGAIYGVLLAFAVIYPRTKILLWGIIPVPSPLLVIIYFFIETFGVLFGNSSGISNITHLGGFIVAWLYILLRMKINPITVWKESAY